MLPRGNIFGFTTPSKIMNEQKNALVPLDEREVVFYDDTLIVLLVRSTEKETPQIFVPLKPLADALGLSWSGQYERIQRDEVLAEVASVVRSPNPQRGNPELMCLPLEFIPGWLFGITASRVKEELREKIIRYRRECYAVLSEAFQTGRLTTAIDPSFEELLQNNSPAAQAYKLAQSVLQLAQTQLLMEAKIQSHHYLLEEHTNRLEKLEAVLNAPGRNVTEEQATQISQAVKAVALKLGEKTKRNEYGGVYGELYRKFGITSYKLLPAGKFEAAMEFLNNWYQRLLSDLPF